MKIANIIQNLNEILAYLDDLHFDDRLSYDDYSTLYDMVAEPLQELEVGLPEELRTDAKHLCNYFKKAKTGNYCPICGAKFDKEVNNEK